MYEPISSLPSATSSRTSNHAIMLFWHLSQLLAHLVASLAWAEFDPVHKQRLEAAIQVMEQELQRARRAMSTKYPSEWSDEEGTAKATAPVR